MARKRAKRAVRVPRQARPAGPRANGPAIVVIDPGHGGMGKVGGSSANNATSPSGLLKKNLTLAVARHAEAALAARGHDVRFTRTTDVNLSLTDRARVARSAGAGAFVSIHFNGFGDTSVQGTETWVHQRGSASSVELAVVFREPC